jgi:ketosteroid isomerase-like protein
MYAHSLFVLPAAIGLLLASGCSQAPTAATDTHDADVKAIKDNEAAWLQAFQSKDADKLVAFYSEDATLMVPNEPIINGKAAAKQAFGPILADPAFSMQWETVKADVAKSGELGYTQGTYTMTLTNPATKKPFTDKGKYLTVYKKQADGSWKAVEDTFNSDIPLK